MSGWSYQTATVTVGENSQAVRQLTVSERREFSKSSERIKAGELTARDLPEIVARFGCINPVRSSEEVGSMPPELFDACVAKILELTGMKAEPESDEKKDPSSTPSS